MERNKMDSLPQELEHIINQIKEISEKKKISFAFAFTYPDDSGKYWFEAHTGGTLKILKSLFNDDTNAEALAKLDLMKSKEEDEFIYFSLPSSPLTSDI